MKRLVLLLTLGFAACQPLRAATGDFLFSKVGSDGFIEVNITPNGTDLLGWDGSNNLVQIPRATWLTPATAASTYQLIIGDGDLTIARTSGLQTALDAKQPLAATLTTLSSATAAGLALMDDANATDQRATLGLTIGTNVQAYDPDLTTYAGITPSANVQSLLGAADYSAFRTALGLGSVATLNVSAAGNATNNAIPQLDATGRFITHNALGVADPGNLTRTGELAVDGVIFSDVAGSGFFQFLTMANPTANRTHTLPDASGTLIGTGNLTSINALGTVTTGTWQASDIALAYLAQGGATDGQTLVWDNGAGTWEPGTISTGLTVGTTTTSGAASGDILTSDGTLLQKLTPGTGVSTWLATPTKTNLNAAISDDDPAYVGTNNTFTDDQTITLTSLGTTGTTGLALINATAAANGAQQNSPRLQLTANGYTTGGGSVAHNWYATVVPTQYTGTLPISGGGPDLGYLQIYGDIDGSQNNVRSVYAGYNDLKLDMHGCLWLNSYGGRQLALGGTPAGGVTNMSLDTANGIFMSQNHRFGWVTGFNAYAASDFELARLTTNTLMLTDYTTGGTMLAVMLTHTSATSFEAGVIDTRTTANTVRIGSAVGSGGGTARDVHFIRGGTVKASLESGGFAIGSGGSAISKVLTATASLDFDLTALVVEDKTITVTGAAVGDVVILGVPHGGVTATAQFTGWVSAADTVTIRCRTSVVGENPADTTFRATVIQH